MARARRDTHAFTVAHLTTVDVSLRFLVFAQLRAVQEAGGVAIGISAPGPWVPELEAAGIRHLPLRSSTRAPDLAADVRAAAGALRASCAASASTCCTPTTRSPGSTGASWAGSRASPSW